MLKLEKTYDDIEQPERRKKLVIIAAQLAEIKEKKQYPNISIKPRKQSIFDRFLTDAELKKKEDDWNNGRNVKYIDNNYMICKNCNRNVLSPLVECDALVCKFKERRTGLRGYDLWQFNASHCME